MDPYAQYDGDVPSNDPPPPPQLENWDEYAYLYSDRKVSLKEEAMHLKCPANLRICYEH